MIILCYNTEVQGGDHYMRLRKFFFDVYLILLAGCSRETAIANNNEYYKKKYDIKNTHLNLKALTLEEALT